MTIQNPWRIAVDAGGTFTDIVIADSDSRLIAVKAPSNPANPAKGVLDGVAMAAGRVGLSVEQLLQGCSRFIHGSTVATNTLLENKQAKVGLITTRGFRDFLEIRRGLRENPWDHRTPFPDVLVPRSLRVGVTGRLDARGDELEPLSRDEVLTAVDHFRQKDVEAVAVTLLHSYASDRHEKAVAGIVREVWPDVWISLSSSIAPIVGEYERGSTTVVDAAVAPRIVPYLLDLDASLSKLGLVNRLLIMQSNGGTVSVETLRHHPVTMVLSGPAACVGGLRYYSSASGHQNLISMEIGGTSCDVSLLYQGNTPIADAVTIAGHHAAVPAVDIHTVAAGGGTIAHVDRGGLLVAGPDGAGARPGPACYGLGGTEATVTDAQLFLRRLTPGPYAGGVITLDGVLADSAVDANIATPLRMERDAAAHGYLELVEQGLIHAVEKLSVERGLDPGEFSLIAVGGAGPMHGASVGRKLGCRSVFVPRVAGVFCALGMLNSEIRSDFVQSVRIVLDEGAPVGLEPIFAELEARAHLALETEGIASPDRIVVRQVDLQHPGQQSHITTSYPDGDVRRVRAEFDAIHQQLYGHLQAGSNVEIIAVRVVAIGRQPALPLPAYTLSDTSPSPVSHRMTYVDNVLKWHETPVYDGTTLVSGQTLRGPAIVEEATTTVVVGSGDRLTVDRAGNYEITFEA